MSTKPGILDPSWSASWSNSKSTGFYLLHSPSIRGKAHISVVQPAFHTAFNYFRTTHLPLITNVLLEDSVGGTESLLSPYWNLQHPNGYANYSHLFTASPAVGDQLLEIFGHSPAGMSMQDKVVTANEVVSEHGFSHVWSRIIEELHPAHDASGYIQAVIQDTTIFSTQALQQNQLMRQSLFTVFSYPREVYKADFYNALGTWVTSASPTFLAQHTSLPERLRAIYDSDRVDYIRTFGMKFGTGEVANIIKGIPTLTVFSFRKFIQLAVGKTLTSTYNPPEVHDPSPENMVSDTLYLAEHHLYGSSRLGVKQYTEDMYYTVYDSDDTTLLKRRDWYSYMQDDWMLNNKAAAYINDVYSVSLDSARSLNRIGTKQYELTDHLGNVVVTVLDRRTGIGNVGGLYTGWRADVQSMTDYYPFGMPMAERSVLNGGYRFGYNGMEQDNELKGIGNSYDFGARMYDSRVARFKSVDPDRQKYPFQSPYVFANNTPIQAIDEEGRGVLHSILHHAAKTYLSTIAIGTSASVSFGVGVSSSAGIAVDPNGNFAIFFSGALGSIDKAAIDIKNIDKLGVGANINLTAAIMPFKDVTVISGMGFSLGGNYYTPKTIGGGLSSDFNINEDGKSVSFQGFTGSFGIGTPGSSVEYGGMQVTYATLYSQSDYETLFDTKWDKMGIMEATKWERGLNDNYKNPSDGFWEYTGKEIMFEKVKGTSNEYSVVIKMNYAYKTSGQGAAKGQRNTTTSQILYTGIIMTKLDKFTLQSKNLKK